MERKCRHHGEDCTWITTFFWETFHRKLVIEQMLEVTLQIIVSSAQQMLFSATGDKDHLQNVLASTTYDIGRIITASMLFGYTLLLRK